MIRQIIAGVLVIAGVLLLSVQAWGIGLAVAGIGFLLGGWGGLASIATPWGRLTGAAGLIMLLAGFVIFQFFHA